MPTWNGLQEPPLTGRHVVNMGLNLPGPAAAAEFCKLGAKVTKIEPPGGDPMAQFSPAWYRELAEGQSIEVLDLKTIKDRDRCFELLQDTDLFITSQRPAALARLGLAWSDLHSIVPQLNQIAIVGHPGEEANIAGHDLTYLAKSGLLDPPTLPTTLMADLTGALKAVQTGMALMCRADNSVGAYCEAAFCDAAEFLSAPLRHRLTGKGNMLGGGLPEYNLYATEDGWIALAAIEPHFRARLGEILGLDVLTHDALRDIFATQPAAHWQAWSEAHDLPLAIVTTAP